MFEKFFATLNYANDRVVAGQLLSDLQSLGINDEDFLMRLGIAESLYNESGGTQMGKPSNNTEINEPMEYALFDNFTNPFNPSTTINYQLPQTGHVTLKINDILGKEVTYMCIDQFSNCFNMGYNLASYSADLEFSDDPQYFTNVATTPASTRLAVIDNEFDEGYEFKFYAPLSLSYTQQTIIYFNNCTNRGFTWSVAESYDNGKVPIKPVILHELGHVLGLGHNNWYNGWGTLRMKPGNTNYI